MKQGDLKEPQTQPMSANETKQRQIIQPRFYAHGVAAPGDLRRSHEEYDRKLASAICQSNLITPSPRNMVNTVRDGHTHPETTALVWATTGNELMQHDCCHLNEVTNDNSCILAAIMSFAWSVVGV